MKGFYPKNSKSGKMVKDKGNKFPKLPKAISGKRVGSDGLGRKVTSKAFNIMARSARAGR